MPRLLFVVFASYVLTVWPASAQQPTQAQARDQQATTATPLLAAGTLTPDQAKRALETLQDDTKRTEIINTLRAIANAQQPSTAPAKQPPVADDSKATASIVGQIRCTDAGRWPVQREFNRRMTLRFKERGVEIAS